MSLYGYKCQGDSYELITGPANPAVSLEDAKEHLKIDLSFTDDDDLITSMIAEATLKVEHYIHRDLITKEYKTFRDKFPWCKNQIELRRSKVQELVSFKYLVDDVLTDVDTDIYYNTFETDYSGIFLKDGQVWPTDIDIRRQSIEIQFKAGYGTDSDSIPADIRRAILMIVACLYQNRGDCSEGGQADTSGCITQGAKKLLQPYIIVEISTCLCV